MSRIIYEVIYIPWANNNEGKPWIYSGSDYHNNPHYLGSASSMSKPSWAGGLTVRQWWKYETKNYPERFIKTVLMEVSDHITHTVLQSLESAIQKSEDHRNDTRYFNRTNKHFNSNRTSNPLKGMTYDEIYGKEKSQELKLSKSLHFKKVRSEKSQWGKNNPMYGRSAAKENNLRWYNNGIDTIFVTEGSQPIGYVLGRVGKLRRRGSNDN